MSYIVIVTGERDWEDRATIYRVLDEELHQYLDPDWFKGKAFMPEDYDAAARAKFVLRHGVSGNTDFAANDWGKERGVTIERFPADWNPPSGYNPGAGPARNLKMARTEPRADMCCAFWSGKMRKRTSGREFSGTLDMIKVALLHQIPVCVTPPSSLP